MTVQSGKLLAIELLICCYLGYLNLCHLCDLRPSMLLNLANSSSGIFKPEGFSGLSRLSNWIECRVAIMHTAKPARTAACVATVSKLLWLSSNSWDQQTRDANGNVVGCNLPLHIPNKSLPFNAVAFFLMRPGIWKTSIIQFFIYPHSLPDF